MLKIYGDGTLPVDVVVNSLSVEQTIRVRHGRRGNQSEVASIWRLTKGKNRAIAQEQYLVRTRNPRKIRYGEYVVESGFTVKFLTNPLKLNYFEQIINHFMILTDCKRHMLIFGIINMFISLT